MDKDRSAFILEFLRENIMMSMADDMLSIIFLDKHDTIRHTKL